MSEGSMTLMAPPPDGWAIRELGDLIEPDGLSYGVVQPGSDDDAGVPLVRVKNIRDGRVVVDDVVRISRSVEEKYQRSRLRGGEVLLTLVGSVGLTAVVPAELADWNVARAVAVIRPSSIISAEWLKMCLSAEAAQCCMATWQTNTVQATLNLRDVRRLPVILPPEHCCSAIVALVGALDDKIAANLRASAAMIQLAEYMYQDVTSPNGGVKEVAMCDVATIIMGHSPSGESCNRRGEGEPLLNGPTEFGDHFPQAAQWTTAPTRFCEPGDILLCVRGSTTGRLNWADRTYVIGRGLAAIRSRRSVDTTGLVYFALVNRMSDLLSRSSGSVFPNLARLSIESLPILWPAERLAEPLAAELGSLLKKVAFMHKENVVLASLRDTLLPRLMSGEIRVQDAEKVVEDVT